MISLRGIVSVSNCRRVVHDLGVITAFNLVKYSLAFMSEFNCATIGRRVSIDPVLFKSAPVGGGKFAANSTAGGGDERKVTPNIPPRRIPLRVVNLTDVDIKTPGRDDFPT